MSTLAELRTETGVWLDDPKKTRFDAPLLNTLLNMAYPMIVGMIEGSGKLWNLSPTPIVLTVVPTSRMYPLEYLVVQGPQTPGGVMRTPRRIVNVYHMDGTNRVRVPLAQHTEISDYLNTHYPTLRNIGGGGVSVYRASDGVWRLQTVASAPDAQTLEVDYIPTITPLASDSDVPTMVPTDYHHVIAMQAAIIGKGTEERVNSTLELHFREQVGMMLGEASNLIAARSQRM